jgi:hypothetical protein
MENRLRTLSVLGSTADHTLSPSVKSLVRFGEKCPTLDRLIEFS